MESWQEIHPNFTDELAYNWQKEGFDFEQTKKWINLGFNPNDCKLVSYVKNELCCDVEEVPDYGSDITIFRKSYQIYQKSLEGEEPKTQKDLEVLQIQQAINESWLSLHSANFLTREINEDDELQESEIDMGWLTDDNIAYILENDEIIKKATDRNVQIRTDIANIYFQIEEAKQGRKIADEFWNTLETKKKHILLPLRVSGNHWSLLIIVQNESSGRPWYLNYISSLSYETSQQEVEEIKPFLQQIQEKFKDKGFFLFNENDKFKIIKRDNPRQPNAWDCGVYLCLFVEFLSQNELYMLDEENLLITHQEVKEFREKWKSEIGAEKWCKWDTAYDQKNDSDEDTQLAEALKMSLLTSVSEEQLEEVKKDNSQTDNEDYENWTHEQLTKEIKRLKAEIERLKTDKSISSLEKQLKLEKTEGKNNNSTNLNRSNNNFSTGLVVGSGILLIVGLVAALIIRKKQEEIKFN